MKGVIRVSHSGNGTAIQTSSTRESETNVPLIATVDTDMYWALILISLIGHCNTNMADSGSSAVSVLQKSSSF